METSHYCLRAPARQIRLLDLQSPTPSGGLQGRLRRVPIDDPPPFVAVSHVWGTKKAERPVHLHSGCGSKAVEISANLEAFFIGVLAHDTRTITQFWDGDERLPLWTDMTCINQSDMREKASQISLMRDIYSKARYVVVWINEFDSRLRYAFRYLRRLADRGLAAGEPWAAFDLVGWDGIKRLVSCDWFSRRWTVQEAAIPGKAIVMCGSDAMPMDLIFRGVNEAVDALLARPMKMKLLNRCHTGEVRPVRMLQHLKRAASSSHPPTLLWLLENLRFTSATLAHDQVYALLGLCDPRDVPGNPVRYDLEPEEAYRACVKSHALVHGSLDFLGLCAPAQRDGLACGPLEGAPVRKFRGPSWVPNFHSANLRRCLGVSDAASEMFFDAARGVPVDFAFEGSRLGVSGVFVDRIRVLGDFARADPGAELSNPDAKLYHQYFDFWEVGAADPSPYPDRTRRAEVFIRTLTLLGVYLGSEPSPEDILTLFHRWSEGSKLWAPLEECGVVAGDEDERLKREAFVAMKRLTSWEPFLTERGYMGLAREASSPGDEVWVIGGCRTPILLSPQMPDIPSSSRPARYQVKGEVLLDGFMFGELVSGEAGTHDVSFKSADLV